MGKYLRVSALNSKSSYLIDRASAFSETILPRNIVSRNVSLLSLDLLQSD